MEGPNTETQHVVPYEGKWGVKAEKAERPSKTFDSKILAAAYAFDVANNNDGKVVIHSKDGTIKNVNVTENTTKLLTALSV